MNTVEQELDVTQRAYLNLQIENAQLKLMILDLRKELASKNQPDAVEKEEQQ